MIYKLKGKLVKKEDHRVIIDVNGIFYEVNIPQTVARNLKPDANNNVELIIYHYLSMDQNRGIPVLVGFSEELEKDFFEKFISVTGVGPRAALKAFEEPVPAIAQAIERGDSGFLTSLVGIGNQRAKQIIAHLQGKVGRFALIRTEETKPEPQKTAVIEEAKQILRRLQYNPREIETMIEKAVSANSGLGSSEELLNEIYRQRK
ncbi:MAG: Holliday junction branch migration protein RuvA [Candidatus Omnitrophica bacterium]|nr:Holliday junction branch migration protein RuvA [Candidatus Omnitrophota bacterium]MBU2251374.1 Holliday junction branch migration protein RuvA [Candidatus Omnitrophota bacterium]MBU2265741.1 Holliday junction branch migration protein RuvA [Candidatus Omnitrophota bacterium]MBU2473742.1 Holliday junction branch migration protein RuvA [Candidatus Omnitrophota bacterium]